MELSELNPTEQLVLVGLVKALVHADRIVTTAETATIHALAQAMGEETWNARVAEARARIVSAEHLFELARAIVRIDARFCIYAALRQLAESDTLDDREDEILTWVSEVWQLGGASSDRQIDEEDLEDETTFEGDFVLFDPDEA